MTTDYYDDEPSLYDIFHFEEPAPVKAPVAPPKAPKDTHRAKRERVAEPGRNAVLDYLLARVGREVSCQELIDATGHKNSDGRVTELRNEGWQIACGKRTAYSEALGLSPDDGSQLYCLLTTERGPAVRKHVGLVFHYTEAGATVRVQQDVTNRLSAERRQYIADQLLGLFEALVESELTPSTLCDEDFER